jgi:hypothetical protein
MPSKGTQFAQIAVGVDQAATYTPIESGKRIRLHGFGAIWPPMPQEAGFFRVGVAPTMKRRSAIKNLAN